MSSKEKGRENQWEGGRHPPYAHFTSNKLLPLPTRGDLEKGKKLGVKKFVKGSPNGGVEFAKTNHFVWKKKNHCAGRINQMNNAKGYLANERGKGFVHRKRTATSKTGKGTQTKKLNW